MKQRRWGNSDIYSSEVGFGCWTVSTTWWGITDEEFGKALLREAADLGVTLFDTADTYGNGRGETILAETFGKKLNDLVVASKFGYEWQNQIGDRGHQELPQNWSGAFVRQTCEEALKRLNREWIDIWQLHNPKGDALQAEEVWTTLADLKREGKIRLYGVALGPAIGWLDEGIGFIERKNIDLVHHIYNLLEQEPGRDFYRTAAGVKEREISFMVRVPHSSGLLEGKYTKDTKFEAGDHRNHRKQEWLLNGLKKLEKLGFLTEGRDLTLGQAALKYILANPQNKCVLPNIYNSEQLREFVATSEKPDLAPEDITRVNDLYDHGFYLEKAEVTA